MGAGGFAIVAQLAAQPVAQAAVFFVWLYCVCAPVLPDPRCLSDLHSHVDTEGLPHALFPNELAKACATFPSVHILSQVNSPCRV